jgi:hypothetical protein
MSTRRTVLAGIALAATCVAGCTAIPTSSAPQIVKSIDANGPDDTPCAQPEGDDARSIVIGFLDQNLDTRDPNHSCARNYLTGEQRNRWQDSTITVVNSTQIGNFARNKVTVTGQEVGTVDASGGYTPSLAGDGSGDGGDFISQTYDMVQTHGQWRIDGLPKGLLLTVDQFEQYQQKVLYFFDVAENLLVPDPRYTQLTDPTDLGQWLLAQLVDGPEHGSPLQTGLPDQTDVKRVTARFPTQSSPSNTPVKIEIPGAAQLDADNRDRLASQLATTLEQATTTNLEITDGGVPVPIPAAKGVMFSSASLATLYQLAPPAGELYFVRSGGVFSESGQRLPGRVGAGIYDLDSVAIKGSGGTLDVAGVRGTGSHQLLDVGTADQLRPTTVQGDLSRPAWAPDIDEVWIGNGSQLMRVSTSGVVHKVQYTVANGRPSGRIVAVRISPDGGRVALVLASADRSTSIAQVYVGSVVRGTAQVQVTDLVPITPQGVQVADLAWNTELNLFAIGKDTSTANYGVWEVQCDGSLWTPRGTTGLPGAPDAVTVTANSLAAVSIGGTLWRQTADSPQAGSWQPLLTGDSHGTAPVYVE